MTPLHLRIIAFVRREYEVGGYLVMKFTHCRGRYIISVLRLVTKKVPSRTGSELCRFVVLKNWPSRVLRQQGDMLTKQMS
jgi:hypothetical protein